MQQVEQLRRQRWTRLHIAQSTGLSRATLSRILRRLGLNRMADLEPTVPIIAMNLLLRAICSIWISSNSAALLRSSLDPMAAAR